MAEITAKLVKELRKNLVLLRSGRQKHWLKLRYRKWLNCFKWKRHIKAAKKADRVAAEGRLAFTLTANVAAVVEVNAEIREKCSIRWVGKRNSWGIEGNQLTTVAILALTMPSGETLVYYVTCHSYYRWKDFFHSNVLQLLRKLMPILELTNITVEYRCCFSYLKVEMMLLQNKSMHIAAMKTNCSSYTELDEQFVKDELAQPRHDNESRAMVNKLLFPHLKYGSKAHLTDAVLFARWRRYQSWVGSWR